MDTKKILVADDDMDTLENTVTALEKEGFEVIQAIDGEEAWERITADEPDVIVMDVGMPKMDGFTVLKQLRTNPPTKKWQPVIICSARGEMDDMAEGFSLNADHYLVKPVSTEDLLKAVRLMLALIPQRISDQDG